MKLTVAESNQVNLNVVRLRMCLLALKADAYPDSGEWRLVSLGEIIRETGNIKPITEPYATVQESQGF